MPATYLNQINIVPKGFPETMKALGKLTPDLKEAVRETVRKAIPFAENEAVAQILKRYEISKTSLMDQSSRHGRWRFKPKYPTGSNLSGGIQVTGTRMPVMRFSVIPADVPDQCGVPIKSRTPIEVRILKRGGVQIGKPNVFMAKMKSGHVGVYRRKIPNPGGPRKVINLYSCGRLYRTTQLPISEEYMLSVPEMLTGKKLRKKFDENLNKYVVKTMLGELRKVSLKAWASATIRL